MDNSYSIDADRPTVVVLATTPPPVTGMTLVTEQVVCALEKAGPTTFFNWSTGISKRGLMFRTARVLRILRSFFFLLRNGRVRNGRLYIVANSKIGLLLTAAVVWLARRLNYTVYLHHHTYYYIDERDWRAAWINRMLGGHGVHVVHTPQMADDYQHVYPGAGPFVFVYPSVVVAPIGTVRGEISSPIRLGHLANLSVGKGLDLVLDTFQTLRDRGHDIRLTLAGTFLTQEARRVVEQAVKDNGGLVEYVGPVYGEDKTRFFASIDCFVFPSRSESWGIVLHESMASGVPVVAYNRGCARTVIGEQAGVIVDRDANFAAIAVDQIERWINDKSTYHVASQAAIEQALFLEREGDRTLNEFVAMMFAPSQEVNAFYRPA